MGNLYDLTAAEVGRLRRSAGLATFTAATLPPAAKYPGERIRRADLNYSDWWSDGSAWRPVGGRYLIAARNTTVATPLATLSGITDAQFNISAVLLIPAGMVSQNARILVDALMYRSTAVATAKFNVRLGTQGAISDPALFSLQLSATANLSCNAVQAARFSTNTGKFTTNGTGALNGTGTSTVTDKTSQVDTTQPMYVSFDISNGNVGDTFIFLGYSVWLEA